jgi:hypothetical protein
VDPCPCRAGRTAPRRRAETSALRRARPRRRPHDQPQQLLDACRQGRSTAQTTSMENSPRCASSSIRWSAWRCSPVCRRTRPRSHSGRERGDAGAPACESGSGFGTRVHAVNLVVLRRHGSRQRPPIAIGCDSRLTHDTDELALASMSGEPRSIRAPRRVRDVGAQFPDRLRPGFPGPKVERSIRPPAAVPAAGGRCA